jgi:NAD(P)-dependent dehydrogenase (short-subunit alcohol dehydrogenase family)
MQSVLITGASSGFGRLTAETLAQKGYTVVAAMRDPEGKNSAASSELKSFAEQHGVKIHVVDIDVTREESVQAGVAKAIEAAGQLDVIINNAGLLCGGLGESFTDEQVRAIFDTNVFGPHRVLRAALPHMRARGSGLLIAVSTTLAQVTLPFMAPYTASKRALEGLVETYRYELAPLGIDSVIVEPGGHLTPIFNKVVYAADAERSTSYGPLADEPAKFFGGYASMLESTGAGKPQAVADAIAEIIAMPAGTRPIRVVVDTIMGDSVKSINGAVSQVQHQTFHGFGIGAMLGVKGSAS